MSSNGKILEENKVPLLDYVSSNNIQISDYYLEQNDQSFGRRFWIESKKLWRIVGPAIFSRIASYSMFVITQAFAGHLGDLELASMSIASNVILGFDFGLMLGMASALETLCGQAFGAKKYYMLGVYLQRSWIVLFLCCIVMMPIFFFATPVLKFLGQPDDVAELSGVVVLAFIPMHFCFAFQFPLQRFLQSQLKNNVIAWANFVAFITHVLISWLIVYKFQLGIIGTTLTLNFSWWLVFLVLFCYTICGGCPLSWTGFSMEAFSGLWDFFKLSASSGVMLCLENWYYKVLIVMTGNLENAKIALDALSICKPVLEAVHKLSILLAFTVLLNSVQPILSGVAVGSGWQSYVAYINLGCYYLLGVPMGFIMGWAFHYGVMGIWAGMIFGGTAVQTLILAIITIRCDWNKELVAELVS
ncbi:hypothetical protein HAX54_006120 [Datura stramonium]|uniref:Protein DETOXIFICATION n=1 Tax=Datura stramonium TaxID=4076 RepID=A0ABS8T9U3_DATST|nr:hypothetical protein [Datura stramonium]